MKLNWDITAKGTLASVKIGRFYIYCVSGRTYKDGSEQWLICQKYYGADSSSEIITLGKIRAKTVDEAIEHAEELIAEIIPENKIGVSLPDGSTLVLEPKDDGGEYPGVYIYRLEPDHEGELDIACIEMPKGKEDAVAVYVYENPETDEFTYSARIPTGGVSK